MTTALRTRVYERATGTSGRVDRKACLIKGVKVLGLRSRNSARTIGVDSDDPYEYDPAAVQAAIPLYEGVPVNIDHPDFRIDSRGQRLPASTGRKVVNRIGRLVNVRWDGAGLRADLEYIASHPLAAHLIECAERMPDVLALSHAAYTVPKTQPDGRVVIVEIVEVESVDLIADKPGTTAGLFESEASNPGRGQRMNSVAAALQDLRLAVLDDPKFKGKAAPAIAEIDKLAKRLKVDDRSKADHEADPNEPTTQHGDHEPTPLQCFMEETVESYRGGRRRRVRQQVDSDTFRLAMLGRPVPSGFSKQQPVTESAQRGPQEIDSDTFRRAFLGR